MPVHEYAITNVHGVWEIRLDGRLVSGQPTQMDAVGVAQALARAGAVRGEPSRILVGDIDGDPIEFPTILPVSRLT